MPTIPATQSAHRFWPAILAPVVAIMTAWLSLFAPGRVAGQNSWTWAGAVDGTWSNANNWSPASVPQSNANTTLVFGAATNTAIAPPSSVFSLNSMDFQAGGPAYTLTSPLGTFAFVSNSMASTPQVVMDTASTVTVKEQVQLNNNFTVTGSGTGTLVLNNGVIGGAAASLTMAAAGTLKLSSIDTYNGPTFVTNGTFLLGTGSAFPSGANVTVSGGTFNTGGFSNGTPNPTTTISGAGTFLFPSGSSGNWSFSQLVMTGGTIDASGATILSLHLTGTGAGVTTSASTTTATWLGGSLPLIQNDTANPLTITVNAGTTPSGIDLDDGIRLSNGGNNPTFIKAGGGTMRLTNPGNTANFTVSSGTLRVDDVAALGSGSVTIDGANLAYGGSTASSAKPLTLTLNGGAIRVLTQTANLTLTGVISESAAGAALVVGGAPGTLTLTANNTYTGSTSVYGQGILAISTIANGGVSSPLGASSNAASNLFLGSAVTGGRGDLVLTGTNSFYPTDRGATLGGLYTVGAGGGIGVQNAATEMSWNGQITGSGSLIKTGAGTLFLNNTTNNYSGGTYVEGGTLFLNTAIVALAGTNVTVFTGGVFQLQSGTLGITLNTVALTGGTMPLGGNLNSYSMQTLSLTGGMCGNAGAPVTLTLNASTGLISYPSAVTSTVTIEDNSNYGIQNNTGQPMAIQVAAGTTASGVDLDLFAPLNRNGTNPTFVKTGDGVLRLNDLSTSADLVVNQGKLRVDNFAALGSGALSLTGGTLQYGGPTVSTNRVMPLDAGLSGIEVLQAGTTLTLTTPLTGNGGLAIRGAGTLVLPAGSTYGGGTIIDGATFPTASDTVLGIPSGSVSVINGGLLQYTASSSTSRTYTLDSGGTIGVAAGQTLTLSGARVYGGYLAGPGSFAVTGGTVLNGVTTFASTPVTVGGPALLSNFTSGGALAIAAGLASPTTFTRFTNQGSGSIIVGTKSQLNVSDFQTYGTLTLSPGSTASPTQMTNTGASPLYFNGGSRTFISIPANAGAFDAGVDLAGQNAVVADGLFVNNGYVVDSVGAGTKTIVADFGALVKGAGFFQNSVQTVNGGKFQSGNSPGRSLFGSFTFGPGGVSNYVFAIDDATGIAGPSPDTNGQVSGWGLVKTVQRLVGGTVTSGHFAWTASASNELTVSLDTLLNPTAVGTDIAGPMADFDPTKPYSWPAVQWTGNYSGPADAAALNAATRFDATGFANPIAGSFGWSLDAGGHSLSLTYTPTAVPEPGTLVLAGLAGLSVAMWRRRRSRVIGSPKRDSGSTRP